MNLKQKKSKKHNDFSICSKIRLTSKTMLLQLSFQASWTPLDALLAPNWLPRCPQEFQMDVDLPRTLPLVLHLHARLHESDPVILSTRTAP